MNRMNSNGEVGRIAERFRTLRARGETAILPYLMAGYPSLEVTEELLCAIVQAGADLVELGVPFSDPLADGTTLQRANHRSLEGGTTLRRVLELVSSVRPRIQIPLVLMSYCNPILRMGIDQFASEASSAGVDGLIVPDLPLEEAGELRSVCGPRGVDLVGMVAPTTPSDRVARVSMEASGFVYCVALKGVTGARSEMSDGVRALVQRVQAVTTLPTVVGFGISTPEHVRVVTGFADGAVVASALVDRIDHEPRDPAGAAGRFVEELKAACHTRIGD